MRAVVFSEAGPSVMDRPAPSGDGVLVSVTSAGICGTDLSTIASGAFPKIPGHEIAGLTPDGRAVAIQPNVYCGVCDVCLSGRSHLCAQSMLLFLGVNGLDGGFATQVLVNPRMLLELPLGMSTDVGALAEPVAVAMHAVSRLNAAPSSSVLVIGAGSIGLLASRILGQLGHDVEVVARHTHQRAIATTSGVQVVPHEEVAAGRFHFILDTAGSQSAIDLAYEASGPGACIVSVGCGDWAVTTSVLSLVKELMLVGSVIYTEGEFADAIAWLDRNQEFAERLITHRFSLEEAPEAFRVAASKGGAGSVKVIINP